MIELIMSLTKISFFQCFKGNLLLSATVGLRMYAHAVDGVTFPWPRVFEDSRKSKSVLELTEAFVII